MNSSSSASEQMPPAQDTSGADQFDRRQMLAAVIGFLILVAGGYSATWGDLTPLQATTLRITVCLSVAGLVASAISMIPAIHIEAALAKIVLFAGIAATGIISYATSPTADRVSPHVSAEMDKGGGQISMRGGAIVPGAINCDCANTTAPNIGGAATRQCLGGERELMRAIAAGGLQLVTSNGRITSANRPLCDGVAAGPAAWPTIGASAKSPYEGQPAPPPCPTDSVPRVRCLPPS
jgi:hypothetical protein